MTRLLVLLLFTHTLVLAEELVENLESLELGEPPEALFVIEGKFAVAEHAGGKVLRLPPAPINECGLLFGKSSKGAMTAEARVFASKRGRRSFPRFALGVHGISGFRVRVVPALQRIELVHQEEVVATAPFAWKTDSWCTLRLHLGMEKGKPQVEAWAWMEGGAPPVKPSLVFAGEEGMSGQGKASIWGTPYSGKEILFDDLKVSWTPSGSN